MAPIRRRRSPAAAFPIDEVRNDGHIGQSKNASKSFFDNLAGNDEFGDPETRIVFSGNTIAEHVVLILAEYYFFCRHRLSRKLSEPVVENLWKDQNICRCWSKLLRTERLKPWGQPDRWPIWLKDNYFKTEFCQYLCVRIGSLNPTRDQGFWERI
jgi:hypothetical protein